MGRGATVAFGIIGGILLFIGAIVKMALMRRGLELGGIWGRVIYLETTWVILDLNGIDLEHQCRHCGYKWSAQKDRSVIIS